MAVTKFPCPACTAVLQLAQVPPLGSRIRCPKCKNVFTVRAAAAPVGAGAPRGAAPAQRPAAMAAARSGARMQAPAVGGSGARMQAPAVGGSAGRMKAPAMRPPSRPTMPPPEEDYEEVDERPRRRPRRKAKSSTNLGMVLGLVGGATVLVLLVVGVILIGSFGGGGKPGEPKPGSAEYNSPEFQRKRMEQMGVQNPAGNSGGNEGRREQARPTRPTPREDNNAEESRRNNGDSGAERQATPDRGAGSAAARMDPNANPFDGLNIGNLPAKTPRNLQGLRYVPAASDMVMGMDLEPLQDHPNLVHFLNKLFDSSAQNDNSTNAKLLQALDGNPMVELVQGAKFANLAGAAMNPQNAGAALASATLIVRTRNPLDHAHLVRTFSAEAIPALDGFKCYSLSAALENGVKFHFYLCFPDGDDRTAILAQAQQPDLDPLVRRGGDLAPSLAAVLDNVEPSHVWMALTMEPVKPMLGMASMFAAQAPPEVQALLKDLPKSQGVIFQLRLQNNQVRVALGLTFPTEGQTLGFSNALRELWANMIQPQLGALSASAGKAAEELFKGVSIGPKRSAALASTQISFATLKTEYPQLVAMMNQAQQMAASMGGAAGVPGGAAANPNSAAAMDKPEAGSPAMPPSSSGKKSKSNPSAAIGVKEGNRAPEIVGKDLDGKAMKLSDYRGKVVLLDFWAYWCGPCVSMFPHNKELVERYRGQPFVILGVNEDRTPADIQKGNAEHQLTWRSFMDGTASGADRQKITRQYKIEGYPTMMLIDGNGVIRKIIVGAGPNNARLLDQTIEQLVAELR